MAFTCCKVNFLQRANVRCIRIVGLRVFSKAYQRFSERLLEAFQWITDLKTHDHFSGSHEVLGSCRYSQEHEGGFHGRLHMMV